MGGTRTTFRRRAAIVGLAMAGAVFSSSLAATIGDADQAWDGAQQQDFYTTDQGARVIPVAWFKALKTADGSVLFAADGLARYGYLPNPRSGKNPEGLPVGFTVGNDIARYGNRPTLGMTCAACHTREIVVPGPTARRLRIDGGPGIVDFYAFLRELDAAVFAILVDGGDFDGFARRVLGAGYSPGAAATLKPEVVAWYADFGPFMKASLPDASWGPTRLDAFGMIFNRVTGLDLGIPDNLRKADAPVRYPFLWNAARQDKTQWPGVAPNGLYTFGLGRNTGEVYGVFARFKPTERIPFWVTFNGAENSARFVNLHKLELLVRALAPPKYPLPIDPTLAAAGEKLFVEAKCQTCHWPRPGDIPGSWATPVQNAGTDRRMYDKAHAADDALAVSTGILEGVSLPQWAGFNGLARRVPPIDVLSNAVGNTLLQELASPRLSNGVRQAVLADLAMLATTNPSELKPPDEFIRDKVKELYNKPQSDVPAYESRVLSGIWAAAPYLHNGSAPSLWALLQKVADRPSSFSLGSNQLDPKCVGLTSDAYPGICTPTSASTSPLRYTYKVTSCDPPDNGNGNCGHLWGTDLADDQKWALIEYMKGL